MKKSRILLLFSLILLCYHTESTAQRSNIKDYVRIEITPDHDDWTYRTNEQASFTIRVIRGNVALKNIPLTYEIGPEKMPPVQTGKSRMEKGFLTVKAGTMKTPGFTTCLCRTEVDGIVYSNYVNIGFSPDKLEPTTTLPKDFTEFWERAKAETALIPIALLSLSYRNNVLRKPMYTMCACNTTKKELTSTASFVSLKKVANIPQFCVYPEPV